jgi:hypothetical protein
MDEMLRPALSTFQPGKRQQTGGHGIKPPRLMRSSATAPSGFCRANAIANCNRAKASAIHATCHQSIARATAQLLDLFGHAVKIMRQIGNLVAPRPIRDASRTPMSPLANRSSPLLTPGSAGISKGPKWQRK